MPVLGLPPKAHLIMLDLVLAVGHHLLIFGIFGILFAEFLTVRPGLSAAAAAGTFAAIAAHSAVMRGERQCGSVRRYLHIELMLFALLPIFAAAMARGYGEF